MVNVATLLSEREHNFDWMCVMEPGELRDPRRTVQVCVEKIPTNTNADYIPYFLQNTESTEVYKITGICDFFLYKMMRRIVGILVAIGKGDASLDEMQDCLHSHDKHYDEENGAVNVHVIPPMLQQTAPAKGLCLEHIEYNITI